MADNPIIITLPYTADLDRGPVEQYLPVAFGTGDKEAHKLILTAYRATGIVDLTGAGVLCYVNRADKTTVVVDGEVVDGKAVVVLPEECYIVNGVVSIIVKLTMGDTRTTALWLNGNINRTRNGKLVDPGGVVPSLEELLGQIAAMEQATTEAREATAVANQAVENVEAFKGEIQGDITALSEEIFKPYTTEYQQGVYSVNGETVLYSPQITSWQSVVLDVNGRVGETYIVTTYTDRSHPIIFADASGTIITTNAPDTGNPNLKWEVEVTVPDGADRLYINHYVAAPGDVVVDGYVDVSVAKKADIPTVVQNTGDSETAVMSQKAVTEMLDNRVPDSSSIVPVTTLNNKIPVIDEAVPCYLDNMFRGLSPAAVRMVATQNAYIRIYDKTVALIESGRGTGSGAIRLYLNNDNQFEVFGNLRYTSAEKQTGTRKVLFIGDSITENLSYIKPLKELSDAGDYKITFLGTLGTEGKKNEGRGGWAAYNYVSNDLSGMSTNKTNAFWDGSAFNFSYYMQTSGIDVPDYIFINLGTNDMLRGITDLNNEEEIKSVITTSYQTMIDSIREYSTAIPIVLWLPPTRSLAGRNNHLAIDKCLRANQWLIEKFDKTSYISDRVYLMSTYLFVNPYTDYTMFKTVIDGVEYDDNSEPIHPTQEGGLKIAKGIIRQMMYIDGLIN